MIQCRNSISRVSPRAPTSRAPFVVTVAGAANAAAGGMDTRDERLYQMLTALGLPKREAFEHVVILNLTHVLRDCGVMPHGKALTRIGLAVLDVQRRMTRGAYS